MRAPLPVLGVVLVGLGQFAYAAPIAQFGGPLEIASTLVAGLGFLLAAVGLARGAGGETLLATGLVLAFAEAVFGLRTVGGDATVVMSLVWAAALAQAAWYAVRWAARPEDAARCRAGLRLGLGFAALSPLGWMVNDLALSEPLWWPGNLLILAGALVAAHGLAPPAPPAPPRPRQEPDASPAPPATGAAP